MFWRNVLLNIAADQDVSIPPRSSIYSGKVGFIKGKNRIVNKQLEVKTIPTLELQALSLAIEVILETKDELLSGSHCVFPFEIKDLRVYTHSLISLQWLNSYVNKFSKLNNLSTFVVNRLEYIKRQCESNPILFSFTSTNLNPTDCLTRTVSYKTLCKTNYINGPKFLCGELGDTKCDVLVPNTMAIRGKLEIGIMNGVSESVRSEPLIDLSKFSSLSKLIGFQMNFVRFVNRSKSRAINKNIEVTDSDLRLNSLKCLIKCEQQLYYSTEYEFLKNPTNAKNDIPPLSSKMNMFLDCDGLIKVKGSVYLKNRKKKSFFFSFQIVPHNIVH